MNYQPLLMVGGGGLIGLAYVTFRDRNKSADTPDSGLVTDPGAIPVRVQQSSGGGYSGAGYNPTVQAPGTVNTGSPASPDPVAPVYPSAPGVPEIVQPITNPVWVDPNNPAWIPTETRPDYDIENRTPQWDPAYRYGPVTTVNGGLDPGGTAGQTFYGGGTGASGVDGGVIDPSTTYQDTVS